MSIKEDEQDKNIETLIEDLERLQIQVDIVKKQIENLKSKNNVKKSTIADKKRILKVGDTVVVTGSYRNRKGITGKVVKITPAQVRLRPDSGENEFQVYKQNVKQI
jgi:preprotein translocase subunit YajC